MPKTLRAMPKTSATTSRTSSLTLSTVEKDIAMLKGDLATLSRNGFSAPAGEGEAIRQARANIASAAEHHRGRKAPTDWGACVPVRLLRSLISVNRLRLLTV